MGIVMALQCHYFNELSNLQSHAHFSGDVVAAEIDIKTVRMQEKKNEQQKC